jgi:hypothetical protein
VDLRIPGLRDPVEAQPERGSPLLDRARSRSGILDSALLHRSLQVSIGRPLRGVSALGIMSLSVTALSVTI